MPTNRTYAVQFTLTPASRVLALVADAVDHLYTQDGERLELHGHDANLMICTLHIAAQPHEAEEWCSDFAQTHGIELILCDPTHA